MSLRALANYYLRIDLRSLGAFRVLLGVLLFVDFFERWPHIEAFYTASGVFGGVNRPNVPLTLLEAFKTLPQAQLFFLFSAVCYTCLMIGYRTRLFHVLSLVCFLSILNRATIVRAGDDFSLASMLMWTAFLPMGARFSVDSVRSNCPAPADQLSGYSLAAFAAMLQIGLIYFCTAFAKVGTSWADGTAVYYALQLDGLTRGFGHFIGQLPLGIIKFLTWSTLFIEYLALPMILSPVLQPYLRRIIIAALCGLHVGIALTTTLDLFAMKMIATFVLLLREDDWRLLSRWSDPLSTVSNWSQKRLATFFGAPAARSRPATSAQARETPWAVRLGYWSTQAMVAFVLTAVMVDAYNANLRKRLQTAPLPNPVATRAFMQRTQLLQRWDLFAPNPSKEEGWWVAAGVTESGQQLDPLTGMVPTFEKPADLASRNNRLWRKYLSRINAKSNEQYRLGFARYITRINHRKAPVGERLASFKLYHLTEKSPAPGKVAPPVVKSQLLSWNCFGNTKPAPKLPARNAVASSSPGQPGS